MLLIKKFNLCCPQYHVKFRENRTVKVNEILRLAPEISYKRAKIHFHLNVTKISFLDTRQ